MSLHSIWVWGVLATAALAVSCGPPSLRTERGVAYELFFDDRDTMHPLPAEIVTFHVDHVLGDSVIYSSRWPDQQAYVAPFQPSSSYADYMDILAELTCFDSAVFHWRIDSFPTRLPIYGDHKWLEVRIKVLDILPEDVQAIANEERDHDLVISQNGFISAWLDRFGYQDAEQTSTGIYHWIWEDGAPPLIRHYDKVVADYSIWRLDSVLVESGQFSAYVGYHKQITGFDVALKQIGQKGRVTAWLPSPLAYRSEGYKNVAPDMPVMLDIRVKSVNRELSRDVELIEQQLSANGMVANRSPEGIFYFVEQMGEGPYISRGDTVQLNYTGRVMSGEVFVKNHNPESPETVVVGAGMHIAAFDAILPRLRKGDRARLYVPAEWAKSRVAGKSAPKGKVVLYELKIAD